MKNLCLLVLFALLWPLSGCVSTSEEEEPMPGGFYYKDGHLYEYGTDRLIE